MKFVKCIAFVRPSQDLKALEAGIDKPYVFKDIELKTSDLSCQPLQYENRNKIDLKVYLKNFTVICNNKNLMNVVLVMMQDLLGEESLHENINFVELAQTPYERAGEIINLYELQHYIDQINKRKPKDGQHQM